MSPTTSRRTLRLIGALLAAATLGVCAESTTPSAPAQRPRIGLVLAGGGARGLGHIGVIRLLEELRVPVDCVAGTSMGSIVGGLYAAGYTSDEMVAWLHECDWDNMLSDSPARQHRGFRAKQEEIETPRWIEFGVDGSGLKTPNAFIAGQNLLFALRRKTEWVGSLRSFDELPVPFRAVATDLETGEMVVLDHGELADAMRASMAVPGVFAPHQLEGRVLIDGFASRNLPVSIARDMGVDIIIAVDVRADLDRADQLGSPVAMVNQLVSILSQRDTITQIATLGPRDVLVHLKLPGYGASSFRDGLKLADLGYEEAQTVRSRLTTLALPAAEYAAYQQHRHLGRANQPVVVRVEVEGNGRVAAEAVRARLSIRPGERLDQANLEQSIRSVYDLGYFQTVDYRIDHRDEGDVLVVTAKEKPWGPNFAIFGLGLNTDVGGSSEFNIKGALRFTQVNRLGAEVAVRGSLGSVDRLGAEFYQPLSYSGRFFVAPRAEFLKNPERYYADLRSVVPGMRPVELAFNRQTLFADIDLGARLGTWGEMRFGVGRGTARYTDVRMPSVIVLGADGTITPVDLVTGLNSYTTTRLSGSLVLDHLDSAFFPSRGYYVRLAGDHETGARGTSVATLFVTAPARFGDFVLQPFATANYTLESNAEQGRLPFRVGGLFNLSGLPGDAVYGANTFVGGLIARQRLSAPGSLTSLHIGASVEGGNAWDQIGDRFPPNWLVAGSAFIAVDTPLGPLHLAAGAAEGGNYSFYVYLGRILP